MKMHFSSHEIEELEKIDRTLFEKIWIKSTTANSVITMDTVLYNLENFVSVDLNPNGQFLDMIRELGRQHEGYQQDLENIHAACFI